MSGGISLRVMIIVIKRNHFIQFHQNIPGNTGIRILVDGNARCGMGNKNMAYTGFYSAFAHSLLDFPGDINKLGLRVRSYIQFNHQSDNPPNFC